MRVVEFQMNPSRRDLQILVYAEYWCGWILQIYFAVVATLLRGVWPRIG
jgi:hypothetical protein